MENMEQKIREIIKMHVQLTRDIDSLTSNDSLIDVGLDSLSCIKVLVIIEEQFGIEFLDEDLTLENFRNLDSICKCIKSRLSQPI